MLMVMMMMMMTTTIVMVPKSDVDSPEVYGTVVTNINVINCLSNAICNAWTEYKITCVSVTLSVNSPTGQETQILSLTNVTDRQKSPVFCCKKSDYPRVCADTVCVTMLLQIVYQQMLLLGR